MTEVYAHFPGQSALDMQIGGNHYKSMAIQPVEFIHKNGIGFLEGSVIKYVCRHSRKNGVEDLKKARHYIDLLIELEEGASNVGTLRPKLGTEKC